MLSECISDCISKYYFFSLFCHNIQVLKQTKVLLNIIILLVKYALKMSDIFQSPVFFTIFLGTLFFLLYYIYA